MTALANIRGIIFDMDGTLVDSRLDFTAMRTEMGLLPGIPILEQLAELPQPQQNACHEILHRHERAGAYRSVLIPGAERLLQALARARRPMAIVTRNSTESTRLTLERLGLANFFSCVICREDGPHKPDPWAIQEICRRWELSVDEVVMVGDFDLDIVSANRAGCRSVLYTGGVPSHEVDGSALATHVASTLDELFELLAPVEDSI